MVGIANVELIKNLRRLMEVISSNLKKLVAIFFLLACVSCISNDGEDSALDEQKSEEIVSAMSIPELEYEFFIHSTPSQIFLRSEELRFADKYIADELSDRGIDEHRLLELKRLSNISQHYSYALQRIQKTKGFFDDVFYADLEKEIIDGFSKESVSAQCWVNNVTGYKKYEYDVYSYDASWRFSRHRDVKNAFYSYKLYFRKRYSGDIFEGAAEHYRLIGSCSTTGQRPPGCRGRPARSPSGMPKPTYCDPA